jgi:hypothetical protein
MFDNLFGASSVPTKTKSVTSVVSGSGEGGFRTDRHNNPTAMTTDVAATLGLQEGVDYTQGDSFGNGKYYTAKLTGDGVETTIKGLDSAIAKGISPFYTQSGGQRWTHTAISNEDWQNMSHDEKKETVLDMYKKEGGSGVFNSSDVPNVPQGTTKKDLFTDLFSGTNAVDTQQSFAEKTMAESKSPYKLGSGVAVLKQGEAKGFEMPRYDSGLGELQPAKFNITSKDNWLERMAKTAFNIPSAAMTNLSNRLGDLFDLVGSENIKLSDYNKIAFAKPQEREQLKEDLQIKPVEKIAAAANLVPATINMIPSFMAFQTSLEMAKTSKIPVISQVAEGSSWVFDKVGSGLATIGSTTVDSMPMSEESKNVMRQPVAEIFASVGMIGLFKGAGKVAKTGGKGILDKTKLSEKTKESVAKTTGLTTSFAMDPLGTIVKPIVGKLKASIITKVAERQAAGKDITPEESLKIVNEIAKETPVELPGVMEVKSGSENIKVITNQRLVLENFIKGQEDIAYKRTKSLGKDVNGNPVAARFEWDFKNQKATIFTTNKTTAANLAHELGHYLDYTVALKVDSRLSDLLPNYRANKADIDASLASYAVSKLDGVAQPKKISSTVAMVANKMSAEIPELAKSETRGGSEKFATAVKEVITNPVEAKKTAPFFYDFVKDRLNGSGILENQIKTIANEAKTLYHGTAVDTVKIKAEGFKPGKNSVFGKAAFFSDSSRMVATHGKNVLEIKNKDFKLKEVSLKEQQSMIKKYGVKNLAEAIRKEGKYDGFIIKNKDPKVGNTYAITNIKKLNQKIVNKAEKKSEVTIKKDKIKQVKNEKIKIVEKQTKIKGNGGKFASTGLKTKKNVKSLSYNPEKINAPKDVIDLVGGIAKEGKEFSEQRISKSNEDLKKLAQEVGVTVEDLISLKPGSIANAETVLKSRQLVADLAQELRDTVKEIDSTTATPGQLKDFKTKLLRLQGSMKAVAGLRTEAANVFRQFKMEAIAGENDIMRETLNAVKKLDAASGEDLTKFMKGSKELMEPTALDKVWHLWYASVLSGPSTQLKNFFGNLGNAVLELSSEAITNPRGFTNSLGGFIQGLGKGAERFKEIWKEGEISKFEERGIKPIKFKGNAKWLNAADYVGRLMSGVDAIFKGGFYGMDLRSQARDIAIKENLRGEALKERISELQAKPTPEMTESAANYALRGTFNQKPTGMMGILANTIGRATSLSLEKSALVKESLQAVKEGRYEDVNSAVLGEAGIKSVGRLIVPFSRVVANVVNAGLDYSPVGFIREGLPFKVAGKIKGGKDVELSRQDVRQLGRATLGTIGMIYAASLAAQGMLSGDGPRDKAKRDMLVQSGWRANSIKIGDTWVPYQNLGPAGIPLTIIGNYFDAYRYDKLDKKQVDQRLAYTALGSVNSILSMSFLSSLSDLITAVSSKDIKYFQRFAASQATSLVPNAYKQIRNYFNPTSYSPDNIKEQIMVNVGITDGVKTKINVFGQTVKKDYISGLQPSPETKDPLIKFMAENGLTVSFPTTATKIRPVGDRESRNMTPDEVYLYTKYSGIEIKKQLDREFNYIKRLTANQKQTAQERQQDYISNLVSEIRAKTKRGMETGLIK